MPPAPPVTSRMNACAQRPAGLRGADVEAATAGAQGVNFWDAINPFKAPGSAEARAARIARNEERALEAEARRRARRRRRRGGAPRTRRVAEEP